MLMKQMIQLLPESALSKAFTGYFWYVSEPSLDGGNGANILNEAENEDPFDVVMVRNLIITSLRKR